MVFDPWKHWTGLHVRGGPVGAPTRLRVTRYALA